MSYMESFYYPYFSARADLPPSLMQLDRQLALHPPVPPDIARLHQQARIEEDLQVRTHFARAELERMREQRQIEVEVEAQLQLKRESEYLQRIAALRRERDLLEMARQPSLRERIDLEQEKHQITRESYLTDEELLRHYTTGQKFNEYQREVREKLAQQQSNNKHQGLPAKLTFSHETENSPIKIEKKYAAAIAAQQKQAGQIKKQPETRSPGKVQHQINDTRHHLSAQRKQPIELSNRNSGRTSNHQLNQQSNSQEMRDRLAAEAFKRSYIDELQSSKGHSMHQGYSVDKGQRLRGQTIDLFPQAQIDTPFLQHRYGVVSKNKKNKKADQSISHLPKKKLPKEISILDSGRNRTFTAVTASEGMKRINNRLKVSAIVYKDSKLRNQRHELDHLFNTFQNELKGRKEVKDRINSHPDILKKHNMVVQK